MLVPDLREGDPLLVIIGDTPEAGGRIRHLFPDRRGAPDSYALLCPQCGTVWCRLRADPFSGYTPVARLCFACGDGSLSNLLLYYNDFSLPRSAMMREVLLDSPDEVKGVSYA